MSDIDRVIEKLDENNRLLNRMLNGKISSNNNTDSSSSGDSSLFHTTVNGVVSTFSELASGNANASTVLKVFTGIIGQFGDIGKDAANAIGKLGEGVIDANNQLNESTRYGANFGQDLGKYNLLVKEGQLTFEQWNEILRKSSPNIAGLGGNVNIGATAFLKMAKDFTESQVGIHLQRLGVTSEELADTQQLFMLQQRGLNMQNKENIETAGASLTNFAAQLQATAELTGISAKQQKDELERQMQKGEVELALLHQSQTWKDAYNKLIDSALAGMPKIQDLASALATHSKLTSEQVDTFGMLGPAAKAALQDYTNNLGKGSEEEQKQRMINLRYALAQQGLSMELLGAVRGGVAGAQDVAHELAPLAGSVKSYTDVVDAEGKKIGQRSLYEATVKQEDERAARVKEFEQKRDKDTITTLAQVLNDTTRLGKLAGGSIAEDAMKLSKSIDAGIAGHKEVTEFLNKYNTPAKLSGMPTEIANAISTTIAGHPGANPANVSPNANPANTTPGGASLSSLIHDAFHTGSPLPVTIVNPNKKESGSIGTVNKPIEDFGAGEIHQLDGREGVWTEQQIMNFATNARQSGINSVQSMLNQLNTNLKMPSSRDIPSTASLEGTFKPLLDGMLGNIKTIISDVKIPSPQSTPASTNEPVKVMEVHTGLDSVIKDVKDQLVLLNTAMTKVVTNTDKHVDIASKHVDATNKLSGNRF